MARSEQNSGAEGRVPSSRDVIRPGYTPLPESQARKAVRRDEEGRTTIVESETLALGYEAEREDDALHIPSAPRLPRLDLELTRPSKPAAFSRALSQGFDLDNDAPFSDSHYPKTIPSPAPRPKESYYPKDSSEPGPFSRHEGRSSWPISTELASADASHEADSTLYFAPHIRIQATQWFETGTLSLSGASSRRHSRALQRALLLCMLHQSGWGDIPEGLKQRAQRLFRTGWGSSEGQGRPDREIDDLVSILGMNPTDESRNILQNAAASLVLI